jgi:hypothetical protein
VTPVVGVVIPAAAPAAAAVAGAAGELVVDPDQATAVEALLGPGDGE